MLIWWGGNDRLSGVLGGSVGDIFPLFVVEHGVPAWHDEARHGIWYVEERALPLRIHDLVRAVFLELHPQCHDLGLVARHAIRTPWLAAWSDMTMMRGLLPRHMSPFLSKVLVTPLISRTVADLRTDESGMANTSTHFPLMGHFCVPIPPQPYSCRASSKPLGSY